MTKSIFRILPLVLLISFLGLTNTSCSKKNKVEESVQMPEMDERTKSRVDRMAENLDLTEAQQAAVALAVMENDEKMAALKNSMMNEQAKRAKMQENRKELQANIQAILSPEQLEKFNQKGERGPGQFRPGGKERPGGGK